MSKSFSQGLMAAKILADDAIRQGLNAAGEQILLVSNLQVPHEEGDLMRSGAVTQDDSEPIVAISYDTPYAIVQHEDLTFRHDDGRNAKFLENALRSESIPVTMMIANRIRSVL